MTAQAMKISSKDCKSWLNDNEADKEGSQLKAVMQLKGSR